MPEEGTAEAPDLQHGQRGPAVGTGHAGEPVDELVTEVVEQHRVLDDRHRVHRLVGDGAEAGHPDGAHQVHRRVTDRAQRGQQLLGVLGRSQVGDGADANVCRGSIAVTMPKSPPPPPSAQ
jgi:hypothetical protein